MPASSIQSYARTGGALCLVIIVAGVFVEAFVRGGLIVSHDAAATGTHIVGSEKLWRVGLAANF